MEAQRGGGPEGGGGVNFERFMVLNRDHNSTTERAKKGEIWGGKGEKKRAKCWAVRRREVQGREVPRGMGSQENLT